MHASRFDGATVNQLRSRMSDLELEAQQVRRENNMLLQRFTMAEQANGEVTRRIGALEIAVPQLLDRAAVRPQIDRTMTGAIGEGQVLRFDADGGSVSVQQKPLLPGQRVTPEIAAAQDEAPAAGANPDAFGLALGFPVSPEDAEAEWQSLTARVGTLLIGMAPLLAAVGNSDGRQIVAGPLASRIEAEDLCARMDRVGIPCAPATYVGESLPLLN